MQVKILNLAADELLAGRLLHLQHAAYSVEADLIGDDRIPPLNENIDDLRSSPFQWAGAFDGEELVAAVAWGETAEEVDIGRLVVSPSHHRRGLGKALVREVLELAGGRRTTVSTGRDNPPARQLYEQLGFSVVGDEEVLPGLWVTRYALAERPR